MVLAIFLGLAGQGLDRFVDLLCIAVNATSRMMLKKLIEK
jgi:hypothetical protein